MGQRESFQEFLARFSQTPALNTRRITNYFDVDVLRKLYELREEMIRQGKVLKEDSVSQLFSKAIDIALASLKSTGNENKG